MARILFLLGYLGIPCLFLFSCCPAFSSDAPPLTASNEWKVFYAIIICLIWGSLYFVLRPVAEFFIEQIREEDTPYHIIQESLGWYTVVMMLGCLFTLSLLGR